METSVDSNGIALVSMAAIEDEVNTIDLNHVLLVESLRALIPFSSSVY